MNRTLRGSCACGRNRYLIEVPTTSVTLAQILFDTTNVTRQHSASPFIAWLRVPLEWYRSATFAQFPDETPLSIRRTFISPFASNARRQFCGYCGTQLSSWNERTKGDADFISLTLGSLLDDDLVLLEEMGLLPADGDDQNTAESVNPIANIHSQHGLLSRGAPWFESMVDESSLGRFKRHKGGRTSNDGSVRVEWEIVEWTGGDDADMDATPIKRKHNAIEDGDVPMQHS